MSDTLLHSLTKTRGKIETMSSCLSVPLASVVWSVCFQNAACMSWGPASQSCNVSVQFIFIKKGKIFSLANGADGLETSRCSLGIVMLRVASLR